MDTPNHKTDLNRQDSGFTMVALLTIGIVAMIWMSAIFAMMLPSFRQMTSARNDNLSRASAEAAIDWACDQMSTAAGRTALDAANQGNSPPTAGVTTNVPSDQLPSGCSATVTLKAIAPTANSAIYSQQLSDLSATSWWRVMTVRATIPGGAQKIIRVAMMPTNANQNNNNNPAPPNQTPNPFFANSLAAYNKLDIKGGAKTYSVQSSTANGTYNGSTFNGKAADGDIAANGSINISNGSQINGDISVYGNTTTTTKNVTSDNANGTHVNGVIFTNGETSITSKNVQNVANDPNGAIQTGKTHAPIGQISTTPPPTATPMNLTSVNSTIALTGGTSYTTTSMSIGSKGGFNVSGSGGATVYVNGAGGTLTISSNKVTNTIPANLRVIYTGTEDVHIDNGANFVGVIYAPNAHVHVDNGGMIVGAVLAKNVTIDNGGTFAFDTDLANANLGVLNGPTPPPNNQQATFSIGPYQALSWQEF